MKRNVFFRMSGNQVLGNIQYLGALNVDGSTQTAGVYTTGGPLKIVARITSTELTAVGFFRLLVIARPGVIAGAALTNSDFNASVTVNSLFQGAGTVIVDRGFSIRAGEGALAVIEQEIPPFLTDASLNASGTYTAVSYGSLDLVVIALTNQTFSISGSTTITYAV